MKQRLKAVIHDFLKQTLKTIYNLLVDAFDQLRGRNSMVPPRSMIFTGGGDFEKIGLEFKKYFVDLADLQPGDKVLDVGCGLGRMAVPLTSYLSREGEYWGFDIVSKGVEWCINRISNKFTNFHFQHSDVYNKHYNPKGNVNACDFKFPFENSYFDFVFLTSVFTHMLPLEVENYLSEISRVLKPEGSCLITFFLLNEESENLICSHRSTLNFAHKIQECLTTDIKDPEVALAYSEASVLRLLEKYALRISKPIQYGSWCSREVSLTYQDVVVAKKIEDKV
jgi:ubiquinone/menaquinone biosynthesis C-methylase UbiE